MPLKAGHFSVKTPGQVSVEINSNSFAGFTVRHERHHGRPDAARRVLQAGMETQT